MFLFRVFLSFVISHRERGTFELFKRNNIFKIWLYHVQNHLVAARYNFFIQCHITGTVDYLNFTIKIFISVSIRSNQREQHNIWDSFFLHSERHPERRSETGGLPAVQDHGRSLSWWGGQRSTSNISSGWEKPGTVSTTLQQNQWHKQQQPPQH